MVEELRRLPFGPCLACADLVEFLAYGGFRKGEIVVRGDPEIGTKYSEVRRVPMIPDMRRLLKRLRCGEA